MFIEKNQTLEDWNINEVFVDREEPIELKESVNYEKYQKWLCQPQTRKNDLIFLGTKHNCNGIQTEIVIHVLPEPCILCDHSSEDPVIASRATARFIMVFYERLTCPQCEKENTQPDTHQVRIENDSVRFEKSTERKINKRGNQFFTILLLGDAFVGKTAILVRYTDKIFKSIMISTIGADFYIRTVEKKKQKVELQVWDTAGQERYRTITETYFRGKDAFIVVYSVTDRDSFDEVERYIISLFICF